MQDEYSGLTDAHCCFPYIYRTSLVKHRKLKTIFLSLDLKIWLVEEKNPGKCLWLGPLARLPLDIR